MKFPRWAKIAIVGVVVAVGFVLLEVMRTEPVLDLGDDSKYNVTILKGRSELQKGLSGTKSISERDMMLFDFGREAEWAIWMKDMNFPIDIIWLDKNGEIVHFVKDAQPSTYNAEEPDKSEQFKPNLPARYVIEAISGTIERTEMRIGNVVALPKKAK